MSHCQACCRDSVHRPTRESAQPSTAAMAVHAYTLVRQLLMYLVQRTKGGFAFALINTGDDENGLQYHPPAVDEYMRSTRQCALVFENVGSVPFPPFPSHLPVPVPHPPTRPPALACGMRHAAGTTSCATRRSGSSCCGHSSGPRPRKWTCTRCTRPCYRIYRSAATVCVACRMLSVRACTHSSARMHASLGAYALGPWVRVVLDSARAQSLALAKGKAGLLF